MFIVLFAFIASTIYVVKNGVGNEKLYFLIPIGVYVAGSLVFGGAALFSGGGGAVNGIMGILLTVATLIACGYTVTKVRNNSMARVLANLEKGPVAEPQKKFEL